MRFSFLITFPLDCYSWKNKCGSLEKCDVFSADVHDHAQSRHLYELCSSCHALKLQGGIG